MHIKHLCMYNTYIHSTISTPIASCTYFLSNVDSSDIQILLSQYRPPRRRILEVGEDAAQKLKEHT